MSIILLTVVYLIGYIGLIVLVVWSDRQWYKKHPGAEKRFAEVDEELAQQEGR